MRSGQGDKPNDEADYKLLRSIHSFKLSGPCASSIFSQTAQVEAGRRLTVCSVAKSACLTEPVGDAASSLTLPSLLNSTIATQPPWA